MPLAQLICTTLISGFWVNQLVDETEPQITPEFECDLNHGATSEGPAYNCDGNFTPTMQELQEVRSLTVIYIPHRPLVPGRPQGDLGSMHVTWAITIMKFREDFQQASL